MLVHESAITDYLKGRYANWSNSHIIVQPYYVLWSSSYVLNLLLLTTAGTPGVRLLRYTWSTSDPATRFKGVLTRA